MGTALGDALLSLSQSVPNVANSFDAAEKARQAAIIAEQQRQRQAALDALSMQHTQQEIDTSKQTYENTALTNQREKAAMDQLANMKSDTALAPDYAKLPATIDVPFKQEMKPGEFGPPAQGMEKIPNPDLMDFNPDNQPIDTLKTRNTRLGQLAHKNPVETVREYTGPYAETPQAKAAMGQAMDEMKYDEKPDAGDPLLDLKKQNLQASIDKKNRIPAGPSLALSQHQGQFDETNWAKLAKLVSPLNASSRSVLGVAGTSNMRADRALAILDDALNDPNSSVSEIKALVDTDILGIMKGGVPDAEQIKNGLLNTFGSDVQSKLQFWSSQPQQFKNKDVINRLIEITHGLKAVDNKIIDDMLGVGGASYIPLIARHPDWWEQLKGAVTKTAAGTGDGAGTLPKFSSPSDPAFAALPSGSKFQDANGVTRIKH